ncbi:MAG: hypothetical protein R8K21_05185 [Mariprofundales bacterium]
MSDNNTTAWSEAIIEKTRSALQDMRIAPRNGKVFFKNTSGTRHFVYESELEKQLLRLRCVKNSGTYMHYETINDLLLAGWALE